MSDSEYLDHLSREDLITRLGALQDEVIGLNNDYLAVKREADGLKNRYTPAGYAILAIEFKEALDLLERARDEGTSEQLHDDIARAALRHAWWMDVPHTAFYAASRMDMPQRAPHKGDHWGDWHINRVDLTLRHYTGYYVDLERCTTSAAVLDWLAQVESKTWATNADIRHLLQALDDLMGGLQGQMCGSERERMRGRNWAQALAPKPQEGELAT